MSLTYSQYGHQADTSPGSPWTTFSVDNHWDVVDQLALAIFRWKGTLTSPSVSDNAGTPIPFALAKQYDGSDALFEDGAWGMAFFFGRVPTGRANATCEITWSGSPTYVHWTACKASGVFNWEKLFGRIGRTPHPVVADFWNTPVSFLDASGLVILHHFHDQAMTSWTQDADWGGLVQSASNGFGGEQNSPPLREHNLTDLNPDDSGQIITFEILSSSFSDKQRKGFPHRQKYTRVRR